MKITVDKNELLETVANLSRAVLNRAAIPVLEGILLSAENGILTMMAYNLEIGMTKKLNIKTEREGDIVLNARLFLEILRKLNGNSVTIEVDEKMTCHIKSGDTNFDIVGMESEDFPEMPSVAEHKKITVSSEVLKKMVRTTSFAAAQNENTRPVLTGIKFEIKNGNLTLVAIDGNRLAVRHGLIKYGDDMEFIVSGRAISEAVKTIGEEDEDISIRVGLKHISFEVAGYFTISRLLDGEYIDYKRSIPNTCQNKMNIETKIFMDIVDRVALIINDQIKTPIRMLFADGKIEFTSVSSIGRAKEILENDFSGPNFEIGFNSRYILEALKATETENIEVCFNGPSSAAVIKPVDNDEFLYLVMPMRLS